MTTSSEVDFNDLKFLFRQLLESDTQEYLEDHPEDTTYLNALQAFATKMITQFSYEEPSQLLLNNFPSTLECFKNPKYPRPQSGLQLTSSHKMNLRIIYAHEILDHIRSKQPVATTHYSATEPMLEAIAPVQITPENSKSSTTVQSISSGRRSAFVPYVSTETVNSPILDPTQKYIRWWKELPRDQQKKLQEQITKTPGVKAILKELLPRELIPDSFMPSQLSTENFNIALCYHYYFNYLYGASRNQRISLDRLLNADGEVYSTPVHQRSSVSDDLRAQLFYLRYQNTLLKLENSLLWFNWPKYGHHHSSRSKDKDDDSAAAVILFVLGVIAVFYALKETIISIKNLITTQKTLRSLYRLTLITVGIQLALVLGPSIIFIANIFELSLMAMVGAGLGAVIGRYSSRFFSSVFNHDEINPTSPHKYQLDDSQKAYLKGIGVNLAELNKLLKAVRDVKHETFYFFSSWPWTQSYCHKKKFNNIIQELKDGKILGKVSFKGREYDLFARDTSTQNLTQNQAASQASGTRRDHCGFCYQSHSAQPYSAAASEQLTHNYDPERFAYSQR